MDDISKLETAIGNASLLRSTSDVSPRWFLIGAGAAVAAAAVAPVLVKSDVRVWSLSPQFDWREIYDIGYAAKPVNGAVTFELLRGDEVVQCRHWGRRHVSLVCVSWQSWASSRFLEPRSRTSQRHPSYSLWP